MANKYNKLEDMDEFTEWDRSDPSKSGDVFQLFLIITKGSSQIQNCQLF